MEARHLVLATGYEMPDFVTTDLHRRSSSWCLATVPQQPSALWPERALIWESSHPYLYARTTDDGRIVVGGEDQATENVKEREQLMPDKIAEITSKMRNLWPYASYEIAHAWSAEFGETDDGLPSSAPFPALQGSSPPMAMAETASPSATWPPASWQRRSPAPGDHGSTILRWIARHLTSQWSGGGGPLRTIYERCVRAAHLDELLIPP